MARSSIKQRMTVSEPHDNAIGLDTIAAPVVAFAKDVVKSVKSAAKEVPQAVAAVKSG